MENKKNEWMERLELPKDVVFQDSLIQITGNQEMFIGNFKGILFFSSDKMILQAKKGILTILGKRMTIDYYAREELKLKGTFLSIGFEYS
jgi:sporulation protein YqfC